MCKVLEINRSTYYKKINKVPSQRELDTQKLDAEIKQIYLDSKKRYGAPKIHKILLSNGRTVSLKRVGIDENTIHCHKKISLLF